MTRLVLRDLTQHLSDWAWTFLVALACAVAVSGELAAVNGAVASARAHHQPELADSATTAAVLCLVFVAMAAVSVLLSVCGLVISRRRRDLGLWRALGMRPATAGGVLLAEVALVGAVAGLAGSVLAVPAGRALLVLLIREQMALPGSRPLWSVGGGVGCLLITACVCCLGSAGVVRRAAVEPEAQALREGPGSRARTVRLGSAVRVLLALGAVGGLVAALLVRATGQDGPALKAVGAGFALFALVVIVAPWLTPVFERMLGSLGGSRSVVWHVAGRSCAVDSRRSSATTLPFAIAIGLVGLFFGWRASGASGVTPSSFLALLGPALFVAWAGGVAVLAMGAQQRQRDGALLTAAGARDGQLIAIDLLEGVFHTVSAILLGLIVTVGSMLAAARSFDLDAATVLSRGPWLQVGAMSAATLLVVSVSVVVSRWASGHGTASGSGAMVVWRASD
ncbi:MAG: ABC transporter permease [Acidipropionibacterium sp.]|jgi:putative ABC transport system permease protein|nr:ABC transporter permease [Acidipropionibacterium sp.]